MVKFEGITTDKSLSYKKLKSTDTQQSTWRKFIVEPIKKKSKFGKSANGIILLVDSYVEPPLIWIERDLEIAKKIGLEHELKSIRVYP